jgi:hypothetical protein
MSPGCRRSLAPGGPRLDMVRASGMTESSDRRRRPAAVDAEPGWPFG